MEGEEEVGCLEEGEEEEAFCLILFLGGFGWWGLVGWGGEEREEVGCKGGGGEDVEWWEERVDEADFLVGDEGESEGDEEADGCKLAFYGCCGEVLG